MKKTITLTQAPYLTGGTYRLPTEDGKSSIYVLEDAWFEAAAEDESGNTYTVYWALLDGWTADDELVEEGGADWEHPIAVVPDEEYRNVAAEIGSINA